MEGESRPFHQVVAAVLAAGEASRLGHPKQLLPVPGGTLLQRLIGELAATSLSETMIVLGAHRSRILSLLSPLPVAVRINRDWRKGMSASIRVAADWAVRHPANPAGLLLLAVDQPLVDRSSIERLIQAFEGRRDRIVAAHYGGTLGIPTLFGNEFFPHLSRLQGDRGARQLLSEFHERVIPVEMEEARLDIDRPQDWEAFRASGSDTMGE